MDRIKVKRAINGLTEWRKHVQPNSDIDRDIYTAIEVLKEQLSQEGTTSDLISRQAAIDNLHGKDPSQIWDTADIEVWVNALPSVQPEQRWIPIKWHYCTDKDRKEYGFSEDIVYVFDCIMPDDYQEILVTTSHGYIVKDVNYIDDSFYLDSGYDWITDITAWCELPEPYKAERREDEKISD